MYHLRLALCFVLLIFTGSTPASETDRDHPVKLDSGRTDNTPDISLFMQIGAARPAGFSWDGSEAYFVSSMSGAPQVYRIGQEGWPHHLTRFEDGIDLFSGYAFFNLSYGGDKAIAGASVGGSELSQLFLVDTRTGATKRLTNKPEARYEDVLWAKDDKSIFYCSTEENLVDRHIYVMDIETGNSKKIFGDTLELAGAKYPVVLSQDGTQLIVSRWNSNFNMDLWLIDLISGQYQMLNHDSTDVRYNYVTLMPDQSTIYLTCNNNPDGIKRLAKMDIESGETKFVNDGWIDPRWEVEYLAFSRDFKLMAAVVNEEGYYRLKIREVESRKELPSPPLEGTFGHPYFDQNGVCLVDFQGPTRAPDLWSWDPYKEKLKQITFSSYAGVDREQFSPPSLVKFKSFDSLEIPAFLYLPPGYIEGTPIPFVVHAHGGPSYQFRPTFIRNFQYLILNGYGVLAVNPRGSSGYGLEYVSMDDYKDRKKSLMDYKASVDWLIAEGYTQKGMIGIRGGSYGGYVVLGMITEYPDLFDAAIDIVGIANFETFLKNTKPYRRKNREAEYGPLSDPEFLAEISPIHKASKITTPLLVIHGENDSRVPVSEARQILAAVVQNGGVVDSLFFPDEGHGVRKTENIIQEYRRQIDFFDKYLKPKEN